jgi:hypothetical protein
MQKVKGLPGKKTIISKFTVKVIAVDALQIYPDLLWSVLLFGNGNLLFDSIIDKVKMLLSLDIFLVQFAAIYAIIFCIPNSFRSTFSDARLVENMLVAKSIYTD